MHTLSLHDALPISKSNLTIPGLYFYDKDSISIVKNLKPSKRKELEIVDVHQSYQKKKLLKVFALKKDVKWFDTGDAEEMLEASNYINKYQKKEKKLFGSIEMDSYLNGWITKKQLRILINQMPDSKYKEKLSSLA